MLDEVIENDVFFGFAMMDLASICWEGAFLISQMMAPVPVTGYPLWCLHGGGWLHELQLAQWYFHEWPMWALVDGECCGGCREFDAGFKRRIQNCEGYNKSVVDPFSLWDNSCFSLRLQSCSTLPVLLWDDVQFVEFYDIYPVVSMCGWSTSIWLMFIVNVV